MDRFLTYNIFTAVGNVHAFTTLRNTFTDNDSIRYTGSQRGKIKNNRELLASVMEVEPDCLVFPVQTHSSNVVSIEGIPAKVPGDTDALITDEPGVCLCIQTADCVPVLLYDPVQKIIAAIHAGWRGTVGLIVNKTIEKMINQYGSSASNILAAIGPSIGPEVYQVGEEVAKAVYECLPKPESLIRNDSKGKYLFNLWEANKQLLIECGIAGSNIEISGQCTFSLKEEYFSARREGIDTGRMVSGIMLIK
ncbi:MAG TPA: peptidoglycan editing factor PgeF [Mariniphaga sp.]|nr:peptidoglycan editing factor PgeF [Mariniphaga sp.]